MKAYRFFTMTLLVLWSLIMSITGCKYEPTEPLWKSSPATATAASIDSVVPAQALPGVNIITIYGKNLAGALDTSKVPLTDTTNNVFVYNGVFFNTTNADIVSVSSTVLKVRRPNMVTDSSWVKVVPDATLTGSQFGPYKISAVVEKSAAYLAADNVELSTIVIDNAENLYVLQRTLKHVYKITPSGLKTKVDSLRTAVPIDARISPVDGLMYMTGTALIANNRQIRTFDLTTGTTNTNWITLTIGVRRFDFDVNGNIYAGGNATGFVSVSPAKVVTTTTYYAAEEILSIRVYHGYVYVASRVGSSGTSKVYRHLIDASGNVGAQELVLDLGATSFSIRKIVNLAFSSDGTMYLGTNTSDPILVATSQGVDYFYKSILPTCSKLFFCWGSGTQLHLIGGEGVTGNEYGLYKINMGAPVGAR
jgi:hypothetical protein